MRSDRLPVGELQHLGIFLAAGLDGIDEQFGVDPRASGRDGSEVPVGLGDLVGDRSSVTVPVALQLFAEVFDAVNIVVGEGEEVVGFGFSFDAGVGESVFLFFRIGSPARADR